MYNSAISKRTFLKSLGFLAILGMFVPWLRKLKMNSKDVLPLEVRKEPNAVSRKVI